MEELKRLAEESGRKSTLREMERYSDRLQQFLYSYFCWGTPWKINMEPKKWRWMEDDFLFELGDFWVSWLIFRGAYFSVTFEIPTLLFTTLPKILLPLSASPRKVWAVKMRARANTTSCPARLNGSGPHPRFPRCVPSSEETPSAGLRFDQYL